MTLTRPLSCVSALCCHFTSPKTKTGHRTAAAERSQRQWEEQRVSECACRVFIKCQMVVIDAKVCLSYSWSPLLSSPTFLCSFMTPLHVAAERAHNDIMEVLQKHGAKVHSCSCISRRHIPACALECLQSCDTHIYTPDTSLHHPALSVVCLKGIVYWKIVSVTHCKPVFCYFFVGRKEIFGKNFLLPYNYSSGQREGGNWPFKNRLWLVLVQAPLTDIISGLLGKKIKHYKCRICPLYRTTASFFLVCSHLSWEKSVQWSSISVTSTVVCCWVITFLL